MTDFRAADHAMGLELQIEELQERRQRATVQGRLEDAARLLQEIVDLQAELAVTADLLASEGMAPEPRPQMHDAEKLIPS